MSTTFGPHSAVVRMQLDVDGRTYRIGQLGPEFIILKNPTDHPPAEGKITMWIDDHVRCWRVWLPDGISAEKRRTRTTI